MNAEVNPISAEAFAEAQAKLAKQRRPRKAKPKPVFTVSRVLIAANVVQVALVLYVINKLWGSG